MLLVAGCAPASFGGEAAVRPAAMEPATMESPMAAGAEARVVTEPASAAETGSDTPPTREPAPPPRVYGTADLDPSNDTVVGPPDLVPECHARLEQAGVEFLVSKLPLKQKRERAYTCGTEQAVAYIKGPTGARYSPVPVLDCGMALALAKFEQMVQQEAEKTLGSRVRSMGQLGTYVCRKMAAFPTWVSEHSYANAIDIATFRLENGGVVSVLKHFAPRRRRPPTDEARFLRTVAKRAYGEGIFSVVLTPFYDKLHRNHFHLDLARYRADETGP